MHDDGAFHGPLEPSRKETNPAADGWGLCAMPTHSYVYAPCSLQVRSEAPRTFQKHQGLRFLTPPVRSPRAVPKITNGTPLASCELARWGDNFELISIAMSQVLDPSITFCTTVGFRLSPTTQPSGYVVG
ncbi:hypothetical protein M0657_008545 [Pyricularia oryzae]|nr:hypothetical protein M0657_008545 [Pyricularia oryzae]